MCVRALFVFQRIFCWCIAGDLDRIPYFCLFQVYNDPVAKVNTGFDESCFCSFLLVLQLNDALWNTERQHLCYCKCSDSFLAVSTSCRMLQNTSLFILFQSHTPILCWSNIHEWNRKAKTNDCQQYSHQGLSLDCPCVFRMNKHFNSWVGQFCYLSL